MINYGTEEHVRKAVNKKCQQLYRTWKYHAKKHYKKLVKDGKDPYSDPYRGMGIEHWKYMIENIWTDPDKELIVEQNQKNRLEYFKYNHTMGSRSFQVAMSIEVMSFIYFKNIIYIKIVTFILTYTTMFLIILGDREW